MKSNRLVFRRTVNIISAFTAVLPFLIFISLNSFAQSRNALLDKYIEQYRINKSVPSVSAGIIQNDTLIWRKAAGISDISTGKPASENTLYRIASISKMITAVAVMQLAEKGKINIDEDALNYIPYFPRKTFPFSVRQILNHTAGLRSYRPGEFNSIKHYSNIKEALSIISGDSLMFEPGTNYLYTTLGYNLLGAVIESASGMSYLKYVKENIFKPAGMDSTFADFENVYSPLRAEGYSRNSSRRITNSPAVDLSEKLPGGGFISTSGDLLRFAEAILNGTLVSKSTLDSMTVPTILKNGRIIYYGLGMELISDREGKNYFGHFGYGTGFRSLLVINSESHLAAVHLINLNDRDLAVPALDLAAIASDSIYISPLKILNEEMLKIILKDGIDSALAFYLREKSRQSDDFNFSSKELHYLGYDLIRMKRPRDAVKIFTLYRAEYPANISGTIGLGDAYNNMGNRKAARKYFNEVLRLAPENSYAVSMLKKLK